MNQPSLNSITPTPRIVEVRKGLIDFQLAKEERQGQVKVLKLDSADQLKSNLVQNFGKYPELKSGLSVVSKEVIAVIHNRTMSCLDMLESNVIPLNRSPERDLALRIRKSALNREINLIEAKKELLLLQYYFQLLLSKFFTN